VAVIHDTNFVKFEKLSRLLQFT